MSAHSGLGLLPLRLTPRQAALVESPIGEPRTLFLEGPAGAGKTTAGIARLLRLLLAGVPAESILVLVPQRTLGWPYLAALRSPEAPAGAQVDVLTIGGLAQRSVELYWPLVAGPAGFAHPDRPPVFLTLETAQYYMDRLVAPYLERGAFGEVTLSRQRLISQILDNLNKAAVARFSHREIGDRLGQAWAGESSRLRVYEQVQAAASEFRDYCLERNLLDFSLQIEVFVGHVLGLAQAATALRGRYRHLLADNVEEDVPVAHDLVGDWLGGCESGWLICDEEGGLRSYLGADPAGAQALQSRCHAQARLDEPLVGGPALLALAEGIAQALGFEARSAPGVCSAPRVGSAPGVGSAPRVGSAHVSAQSCYEADAAPAPGADDATSGGGRTDVRTTSRGDGFAADADEATSEGGRTDVPTPNGERTGAGTISCADPRPCLVQLYRDFHTEVIRAVAGEIRRLVQEEGISPGETAVLAPFMGDALRFALSQALLAQGIPSYSQRPSRALREEPAARCLLTLAKLAHPAWGLTPPRTDVAHALLAAIDEMDLVRAWHLTSIVYRPGDGRPALTRFERIRPEEQLKITYLLGNRYEVLREWLAARAEGPALPLDHFLGRLFDEVLSRPGYVFHRDRDSAAVTAHLMDSARRFRQTLGDEEPFTSGSFVAMVEQGVLAAQYLPAAFEAPDAVLLAPAFTFVMANRPVDVQFWLDLSSPAWGRRLYQPLTHPYVLTRHWPAGKPWTDADEDLAGRETLYRLALGLVRRCRRLIYLGDSTYSERGHEERGMLQQVIFRLLRRAAQAHGPGPSAREASDV